MNACSDPSPRASLRAGIGQWLRRTAQVLERARALRVAALTLPMLMLNLSPASAAEPRAERFDTQTWSVLRSELRRPALVVFTTTHCPTCPEVMARVAEMRARQMPSAPLLMVIMDGAEAAQTSAPGRSAHLPAGVDRLYHFQGQQAALRYSVDPGWRGVTPYVALLPALGPVIFSAGAPSDSQWATWVASASPAASSRR